MTADSPDPEATETIVQTPRDGQAEKPPEEQTPATLSDGDLQESTELLKPSEPHTVSVPTDHPVEGSLSSSIWQDILENVSKPPSNDELRDLVNNWQSVLRSGKLPTLRFASDTAAPPLQFIAVPESESINRLWFVGDVHGDILGLETAIRYIDTQDPEATICFLGDLFDRGYRHDLVLFRFMQLIDRNPSKVAFVVGNHDEGLYYGHDAQRFSSSVRPSEASDWLNEQPTDSPWRELANVAIQFFERAPRALLLPDGLLVAHGGVPHVDLQNMLNSSDDLEKTEFLEDFVWTRLHETAKKRIPNRSTRGCSLGIKDFDSFCSKLQKLLGRPVRRIIRGHDHLEPRFKQFSRYREHPVLTINTICHRLDSEMPGTFEMPLIVAKYEAGEMPTIHRLCVPRHLLEAIYSRKLDAIQSEGSPNESR